MTTLADIFPPHPCDGALHDEHTASLAAAYENGDVVPPIVVLRRRGRRAAFGVTGSHRLRAMRQVFDEHTPIATDDPDVVFVECDNDYDLINIYNRIWEAHSRGYGVDAVNDLKAALPRNHPARAALIGQ